MAVDIYPEHEKDLYGWAIHTAELLRGKKMDEVDFDSIIEEIEALGRSEKYELMSRLSLILSNLLKWQYQPQERTSNWDLTIREQRMMVQIILKDNLSLEKKLGEILDDAYYIAKLKAVKETSLSEKTFPDKCPYTSDEIIRNEFYPELG